MAPGGFVDNWKAAVKTRTEIWARPGDAGSGPRHARFRRNEHAPAALMAGGDVSKGGPWYQGRFLHN